MREVAQLHNSLSIVGEIIDKTILEKGANHLYNKYIMPKILPYTAL